MAQVTVGLCFTEVIRSSSYLMCQVPGRARFFKVFISRIRWGVEVRTVDSLSPVLSQVEELLADSYQVAICALLLLPCSSTVVWLVYISIFFRTAAGYFLKVIYPTQHSSQVIASLSKDEKRNMAGKYLEIVS